MTAVERVGVVGCWLMGSGIAEVSARAGLDVAVREVDPNALRDLHDQPRTGRPRRLRSRRTLKLAAVATSERDAAPVATWTCVDVAEELSAHGVEV